MANGTRLWTVFKDNSEISTMRPPSLTRKNFAETKQKEVQGKQGLTLPLLVWHIRAFPKHQQLQLTA